MYYLCVAYTLGPPRPRVDLWGGGMAKAIISVGPTFVVGLAAWGLSPNSQLDLAFMC